MRLLKSLILMVTLMPICGCFAAQAARGTKVSDTPRFVEDGVVATEGSEISAEDGSYTFRGGEPFKLKSQLVVQCWDLRNVKTEDEGVVVRKYSAALNKGAKRVRVKLVERKEPLYGILLLNSIPSKTQGPVSRSYRIEIPAGRAAAAGEGKISVMWEVASIVTTTGATPAEHEVYAWVLWLSDRPFP